MVRSRRGTATVLAVALSCAGALACDGAHLAPAPIAAGLSAPVAVHVAAAAVADRVWPPSVDARIARLEHDVGGRIHVAAFNLATERSYARHAGVPAPLASTIKLALAWTVLEQVETGALALDRPVWLLPRAATRGNGPFDRWLAVSGGDSTSRTITELLRASLVESDNTASDHLFRLVGGPAAVQAHLTAHGVVGIRSDRPIAALLDDRRAMLAGAGAQRTAGVRAFLADARDTGTPAAMVWLLGALHRGDGLSPEHAALLRELMRACATSPTRLRASAPPGSVIAHKTGTLTRIVAADAGIVTLPTGEAIAVAIYLVGSRASEPAQDAAIAAVARLVLDEVR